MRLMANSTALAAVPLVSVRACPPALAVQQQRWDFTQRDFGCRDDVAGALRIVDRLVDAADLAAQAFGCDQPGRIIGAAVDAESAAEALQRVVECLLASAQPPLGGE